MSLSEKEAEEMLSPRTYAHACMKPDEYDGLEIPALEGMPEEILDAAEAAMEKIAAVDWTDKVVAHVREDLPRLRAWRKGQKPEKAAHALRVISMCVNAPKLAREIERQDEKHENGPPIGPEYAELIQLSDAGTWKELPDVVIQKFPDFLRDKIHGDKGNWDAFLRVLRTIIDAKEFAQFADVLKYLEEDYQTALNWELGIIPTQLQYMRLKTLWSELGDVYKVAMKKAAARHNAECNFSHE